jgi:hypothetical protein
MELRMNSSSNGIVLALAAQLACLAVWSVEGAVAAPTRHGFVQRTFVPHRGMNGVSNFAAAHLARRHVRPGAFAFGWPLYWSGPLPAAAAAYPDYPDDDAAPGFAPPPFYPPPWLRRPAPCSKPLVIKVTKTTKPAPNLPRVVYGTPSACGD